MTAGRSVAVDPHSVRQVARGRAVSGLARAYAELYRQLYEQALDQARVQLAGRPAREAHQRAKPPGPGRAAGAFARGVCGPLPGRAGLHPA
jgi:hypothetical protein